MSYEHLFDGNFEHFGNLRKPRNIGQSASTPQADRLLFEGTFDYDLATDHMPREQLDALRRRSPFSLFRYKNVDKYNKEMNILLPEEFREFDPLVTANAFRVSPTRPIIQATFMGVASSLWFSFITATPIYKAPWRMPIWIGVWFPVCSYGSWLLRRKQYQIRKSRIITNNYYKRVRQAILEREKRKFGREAAFTDIEHYKFEQNLKKFNHSTYSAKIF
jgi:hypothetical protein